MSRLFINLYFDEDVSVLVAALVRAHGFVATTTLDQGLLGATDTQQLAQAASRQMCLLTHNRADFQRLADEYFQAGRTHSGIIIAIRRPPREIVQRLLVALNDVTADEMDDQIRYI